MLDIKFIRENPEAVKENIRKKFQDEKLPLVDQVIELDRRNRDAMTEANNLRSARNTLSKQVGMLMGQAKKDPSKLAEAEAAKAQVKANADRLAELEKQEDELAREIRRIMLLIPQMIDPSVPIGPDDSANVEVERFGEPVTPDFEVPYHTEIMERFDGVDMDAAGRVSGAGFYYLMGDIARLHSAVLAYARDFMINKGFTYCIPPFMIPHRYQRALHDRQVHRPDHPRGRSAPDPHLLFSLLPQGKGLPRHRRAGRVPHSPV